MDLENFINDLSEEDFLYVVKLVENRKIISNNKMTIIDFVEKINFEISPRLKRLLLHEAKETVYVDKLLRSKLLRYRTIGAMSLMELEYFFRKHNIDTTYYKSVPKIYLNDLVIEND